MSPIPKGELMKRKYRERKEAGLIEVKLYVTTQAKTELLDQYTRICDEHEIPEELRTGRK